MARTTLQTATADNAEITLTETVEDQAIYITSVSCSFDGALGGTVTLSIEGGATTEWQVDIQDRGIKQFDWSYPLKLPVGADLTARLSASGGAGVSGTLNISYYKGE